LGMFSEKCKESEDMEFSYSVFGMFAMLLYFVLLIDLGVVSTKVSAYILVIIRMLSEVGLFVLALASTVLAFASAISVIKHDQNDFAGIHKGFLSLLEITMKMYDGQHYESYESDPLVLLCIGFFLLTVVVFLLNMLVAQLTCAYEVVYNDMVGYARLERVATIVDTMPGVTEKRWETFLDWLKLDEKTEFNSGDVGVSGGYQILEASADHPTTHDMIKRFGGSTSEDTQWPAEDAAGDENDESERFDRLEVIIQKTLKRITKGGSGGKDKKGSNLNSSGISGSNDDEDGKAGRGSGEGSDGYPADGFPSDGD